MEKVNQIDSKHQGYLQVWKVGGRNAPENEGTGNTCSQPPRTAQLHEHWHPVKSFPLYDEVFSGKYWTAPEKALMNADIQGLTKQLSLPARHLAVKVTSCVVGAEGLTTP